MENIVIENARIMFRNFTGKESKYNRAGDRNFAVRINDPDTVEKLKNDGWNIKMLNPRDPDDSPVYYIKVSVAFGYIPPHIYMINGRVKTELDEDTVEMLDYAEIKNIDLTIRPYEWEVNGNSGVKAYLKTMYVVVEQDDFAHKYDDLDIPWED